MTDQPQPPLVDLSVEIEASPATVWGILTSPALFSAWMDSVVAFQPVPGSAFRAEFPSAATVIVGEVVTIDPDEMRLELTWGVESGPQAEQLPAGSSLVGFRVHPAEHGCRVELVHSRLPSEETARQQDAGWRFHLSRMGLHANRADLSVALERTLGGWFAAWNETDDERRMDMLRACCDDEVEFRDEWAASRGVERLSLHIANTLRFVPGWRLEPTGDVRICRGEALVGWRSIGPDGAGVEGFNHVRADVDGTLRRVTGFPAA